MPNHSAFALETLCPNDGNHYTAYLELDSYLGGATEFYVRFTFDSGDDLFNESLGFSVDDVRIIGSPQEF